MDKEPKPEVAHTDKKDFSTAILDKKKAPNKLMVDDTDNDDNSTVSLSPAKLQELKIYKGDPVLIKGKKRHETLCIALADNKLDWETLLASRLALMFPILPRSTFCPSMTLLRVLLAILPRLSWCLTSRMLTDPSRRTILSS